jgi:hypothetical protein
MFIGVRIVRCVIFAHTMNRVAWFIICTVVGLELIAWGLLVPAHIQAVDAKVLELAGARSPSLTAEGLSLVNLEKTGPARILLDVAQQTDTPGHEKLAASVKTFEQAQPRLRVWGGAAPYLERVFEKHASITNLQSQAIVDLLVSQEARDTLMEALRHSRRPGVLEILRTRQLTNTVLFPPATSPSGQPLDAAIATTALLFQQDHFTTPLQNSIQALASTANHGGAVQPLEEVYLDVLALGKRLNWVQLVDLVKLVPDSHVLQEVATLAREKENHLPVLYAAIHLSESPHLVAQYVDSYPATGMKDLTFALGSGSAAVHELLERRQPIHYPKVRERLVAFAPVRMVYAPLARVVVTHPFWGFVVKYGLCLLGVLLSARAATYLSPVLVEEIVYSRPFLTGPQVAIGLCLLFIILFFTESWVTRATPAIEFPMQVKFPMASAALRATIPHQVRAMTDNLATMSLLIFFVLQATIYIFCRMKLAEIRRQTMPSKLKLRLLENEDNLFDAGLYFGFVGTVFSLILVSLGIVKFSLMAAYSSTAFGIIFVSILKIFSVRPYRRRLILDSEVAEREAQPA